MTFRLPASILFILILCFATAFSGIIEVPKDAETIQIGIDMASDNDTIFVEPGIYLENIDYSGKEVMIIGYAGPEVTYLIPADTTAPVVTFQSGERGLTKFSGFMVSGEKRDHVVFIDSAASPLIENNIFRDNLADDVFDKAVIVCWSDSSLPTIKRNIFYDNNGLATVWIQKGKGNIINNTFVNNKTSLMCNTGLAVVYNNIISYSRLIAVDGVWADFDYNDMYENNGDFG